MLMFILSHNAKYIFILFSIHLVLYFYNLYDLYELNVNLVTLNVNFDMFLKDTYIISCNSSIIFNEI